MPNQSAATNTMPWPEAVNPDEEITERIVLTSCNRCENTGRVAWGTCPGCLGYVMKEREP